MDKQQVNDKINRVENSPKNAYNAFVAQRLRHGVLNVDRAAIECEVNKRTIQRDIKILKAAGVRISKSLTTNSNYKLDPEFRFLDLHITQDNLANFLHTMKGMMMFSRQPLDLLNPLQKELFEMAQHNEVNRRKIQINADRDFRLHTTPAQFNGMLLQGESDLTAPIFRLQAFFLADDMLNKVEADRNYGYQELQLSEMLRVSAHCARITRKYNEAIDTLKMQLKKKPKDAWSWGELAFVYYEKGDIASAIQTLKTGYQKTLEETLNLYLAFLLGEAKRYEAAIKCFKSVYSAPDLVLSFSTEMHKRAGKLDLALQEIDEALAIFPNSIYQAQKKMIEVSFNSKTKE